MGKLHCWQALNSCSETVILAFAAVEASFTTKPDTERCIEEFVCQLYEPGTTITDVADLRWKLFTKKQLEAQKLPPTRGALKEVIARAHYQAIVWYQDFIPNPQLPPATNHGWRADGDVLVPITSSDPPAPAAVIHMVKCGCKKSKCQSLCSCRSQNLNCSELCECGADDDACTNVDNGQMLGIDDSDEDESEV